MIEISGESVGLAARSTGNRMQFDSLDDIRAFCRDLPAGDARRGRGRRAAAAESDKAAGKSRPPRRAGDLAGALAAPRTAAARSRHHRGLCRQSWRRRARRLGLSASRHRTDGGEFCTPAARPSTRSRSLPAPSCAWCRSNSTGRRAISPIAAAMDADEFLERGRYRLSHRAGGLRSARGRRDGHRQHHDGGDAVRGAARRRRGALGRPRHRRRRCRAWRASARRSRRRWIFIARILGDPLGVAAALGGRELAAIAGAVLAARRHRIPVLLDGFVATAAIVAAGAS